MELDKRVLLVGIFMCLEDKAYYSVGNALAAHLAASGWSVITTSRRKGRVQRLFDMIYTAWRRRREYAVAQVDVFSGRAFLWAEAACWTLHRIGKPFILTLHGGNLPAFAQRWPRRVRRLLHSAASVTTPSRYLLEQMRHYRKDLVLLPNPLDLNVYRFRQQRNGKPRLLWLRAFHETYNPSLAPLVLARLTNEFPDVHLCMIGPDKGDGSLQRTQQVATRLGVEKQITYTGGVPKTEVPELLQQGHVFLNTTNVDNTPVSVLEAMACGLCVVSTNVGGIPYLLEHEHDALLVPPRDPDRMAGAVRRLLHDPGLVEKLSYNARQKVEAFDWSIVLPRWEKILTQHCPEGLT